MRAARPSRKSIHERKTLTLLGEALRIVCVADTHSRPHPELAARLRELAPDHIFHAGDIGALSVLLPMQEVAPVTAVRGNIDGLEKPDVITVDVANEKGPLLRMLLTHIAVNGPKLRADVFRLARSENAALVVCGHSHVPFAAHDRGVTIMNPGSVGPRRFQLPIVLGVIDVRNDGVSLRHVDCETGAAWRPLGALATPA
jgi:hypothetical protein